MGVQNRKIVLFIDQCPAHMGNIQLRNTEVVFFPANCTSELQPLDLGIIQSFKFLYRKYLVTRAVTMLDTEAGCSASEDDGVTIIEDVPEYCQLSQKESFKDYVAIDQQVVTSQVQCVEDIIINSGITNSQEDDDDEEEEGQEEPVPTTRDVLAALQTLRSYISSSEGSASSFDNFYNLERAVLQAAGLDHTW
ncbi:tigger transposable element-derived protein 4-like [Bacillus rossius redtenbacheri]|uniref:tigger transposable element-derived protein 4-like n=1 Tax=Bacillus rossius redtenbacheri TaxID=93214 RepID=UPI002FDEFABF